MKYYLRFMVCAVVIGIMTTVVWCDNLNTCSELIFFWCYGYTNLIPAGIANFIQIYFPIFFFHIFWGTFIYRHFCSGAIYYFSRCKKINLWYFKECFYLFCYSTLYLNILLLVSILTKMALSKDFTLDNISILMFIYFVLIQGLFLFSTTLVINLVSIKFSNSNGFLYIEAILFFLIATIFFYGNAILENEASAGVVVNTVRLNPISYILFNTHSSSFDSVDFLINKYSVNFDLIYSIIFYLILSIVLICIGNIVITSVNFISENKENGGF